MLSPPREVWPSLEKWKSQKSLTTRGDRSMNSNESLFIANTCTVGLPNPIGTRKLLVSFTNAT